MGVDTWGTRERLKRFDLGERGNAERVTPTCVDDGFVGGLQEHPELWVHDVGLFGVHAEEGGVEARELLQFSGPRRETVQTCHENIPF